MRLRFATLGAVIFFLVAPAWASDIYTFTINPTKYSSLTTFSVNCTGLPSASCAAFTPSQITVTSEPGSGGAADALVLTGIADVATFANSSGEIWTFDLFTQNITGLGTYSFTGLSGLTEAGGPKGSGYVTATGQVKVSQAVAMPESGALWSLLLVLIPTFVIGWRKDRTSNFKSEVGLPTSPGL
jgi:hypothetical protein